MERLKEMCFLILDQMKMIKEILRLASHGYEQDKSTMEDGDQVKSEDKMDEDIFANFKGLPPPQLHDNKIP
jgi:methylphosphotriester-DNA--protein-cysteine methyltransferase